MYKRERVNTRGNALECEIDRKGIYFLHRDKKESAIKKQQQQLSD